MKTVVKNVVSAVALVVVICEVSYIAGFQMERGRMDAEKGYSLFVGDPKSSVFKQIARIQLGW